MSLRGLTFVRTWSQTNIDLGLADRSRDRRILMLAAACRLDAGSAQIAIQEIEDEIGDIATAFGGLIAGQPGAL